MKDRYSRQKALRAKGIRTLHLWCPKLNRSLDRKTLYFDDRATLESHARNVTFSDERNRVPAWRDTTGFYADPHQDETWRMVVFQWGKKWYGGYEEGNSGGIVVDADPADDCDTAARWAYDACERAAEKECEHQELYEQRQEIEDEIDTAKESVAFHYGEARQWVKSLRGSITSGQLCDNIRTEIARHRANAHTALP